MGFMECQHEAARQRWKTILANGGSALAAWTAFGTKLVDRRFAAASALIYLVCLLYSSFSCSSISH